MELEFYKLSGAGNDFVAVNNMDGRVPEDGRGELVSQWCHRGMGIGADGVLFLEPPSGGRANFRMRYYNADGGEAETCGNGSRCIARFAFQQGVAPHDMIFETMAGKYRAEILPGGDVKVQMTDAHHLRSPVVIADGPFQGDVHFVNTGVPHVVILVDSVSEADVVNVGRYLRHHNEFSPAGANVNFVEITGPSDLNVRTYERGVEDETLACGTGCIASSIIAARAGKVSSPVTVKTAGGEFLTVDFSPTADGAEDVTLQGSAHIVYRGFVPLHITGRHEHHPSEHAAEIESLHL
jgi:diaminopimelate epimerase